MEMIKYYINNRWQWPDITENSKHILQMTVIRYNIYIRCHWLDISYITDIKDFIEHMKQMTVTRYNRWQWTYITGWQWPDIADKTYDSDHIYLYNRWQWLDIPHL